MKNAAAVCRKDSTLYCITKKKLSNPKVVNSVHDYKTETFQLPKLIDTINTFKTQL